MEFTCPHCGKKFDVKTRNASRSVKATAARQRNGVLGGHPKAAPAELMKLFLSRKDWTFQTFVDAVQKKTGATYSRAQGYALLKKYRALAEATVFNGGLDKPSQIIAPVVKNNRPLKPSTALTNDTFDAVSTAQKSIKR